MCVIQHSNWPLRSTVLNAPGTNCSADGFYARTHIDEPYLCYYVVCHSKLVEADAETCFTGPVTQAGPRFCGFQKFKKMIQLFFVSLPGASTSKKYTITFFFILEKNLPSDASANNSHLQVGRPCTWETCCNWHYCCQACSTDGGTGRVCGRCCSCGTWYE